MGQDEGGDPLMLDLPSDEADEASDQADEASDEAGPEGPTWEEECEWAQIYIAEAKAKLSRVLAAIWRELFVRGRQEGSEGGSWRRTFRAIRDMEEGYEVMAKERGWSLPKPAKLQLEGGMGPTWLQECRWAKAYYTHANLPDDTRSSWDQLMVMGLLYEGGRGKKARDRLCCILGSDEGFTAYATANGWC